MSLFHYFTFLYLFVFLNAEVSVIGPLSLAMNLKSVEKGSNHLYIKQ